MNKLDKAIEEIVRLLGVKVVINTSALRDNTIILFKLYDKN